MAAGRTLACPTMVLWAARDDLGALYGNPLEIWDTWAPDLRGQAVESGHHMAEEIPRELATRISDFVSGGRPESPGSR
jgi:haloacetate dehalogenase